MLSQESAAIWTILHLPDGYITEGTQRFTMRCLLLCYYFRGMAGNGVRVCYHGDWTWSSPTILRRRQLDRKLSFINFSLWLQLQCTTSELNWKPSETVQFLLSPHDGAPSWYWGMTFQLPGNFNSWHHGLMSNSWLSNYGGTTPDNEETEPVKRYTPTMAQILL